jgi:hypothetical protein
MSRRHRIPERGDVAASLVAQLLGLSLTECEARQPAFSGRGFPKPDPTTGLDCIEAVDRWRMRHHPRSFPELTGAPTAPDAGAIMDDRHGPCDYRPVVNAFGADRVSYRNIVVPSMGRNLRVNAEVKAHAPSKLASCLGRLDVQIIAANALRAVRLSWPLDIATRASR